MLFWIALTCIGLAIFQSYFFPSLWRQDRLFLVVFCLILAVVGTLGLVYGVKNLVAADTFVCRLSRDILECDCPVSGCGETFAVPISEIETIEKETWSESHRWYIHDKSGHRYWLTSNYDNPADRFVEGVKELNPSVADVTT